MKRYSSGHKSHHKHKRSFLKSLLRTIGIGKKKYRGHQSSRGDGLVTTKKKTRKSRSKSKTVSLSLFKGLTKNKPHRESRSVNYYKREIDSDQLSSNPEGNSEKVLHDNPSHKSKSKYKRAIKRHKLREKRKRLKLKWTKNWQDTLYYLNLRRQPYDPFSKKDHRIQDKKAKIMTIRQYAVYIFNSTVLFLIAYVVAYLTYQLTVIFVASIYGIDSVLYYYEVFFSIGNGSPLWTPFNIILITLSGPIVSLILGLVYYKLFLPRDGFGPVTRLFFLWLSFHSFNMFFGAYAAGTITDQGFGYVANWLHLPVVVKFAFAMISLFILMVIGYNATKPLLETSNSYHRVNSKNRNYFILNQAIIPWILGGVILILIKIPNKNPQHVNIIVYDLIIIGSLAFAIIPTFFNKTVKPDNLRFKSSKRMKFVWLYMLIAILLIVAYRLGLDNGLHFIIRIMFRVAPYG